MTRARLRAALPYLALALLLILAVLIAGRELEQRLPAIEARLAQLGPWGLLAFVGLYVLTTTILIPDTVVCVLAGVLFGMLWGSVAVLIGSVLANALQYALSHRLLRARVERFLGGRPPLAAIRRAVAQDELRLQFLLRLTPLNPATVNYLLGAAGVRFTGFLVTSLAHSPNLVFEVYFGHAGKHVLEMGGDGERTGTLHELTLVGGAVICIVVMVLVSRMARRALARAVRAADDTPASGPS